MELLKHLSRPEPLTAILFDVGSGSVGAALAEYGAGGPPAVTTALRIPFRLHEKLDAVVLTRTALNTLERAASGLMEELVRAGKGDAAKGDVFCVLSSPWHVARTVTMTSRKEVPFAVDEAVLDELYTAASQRFLEESGAAGADAPNVLIDREAVNVLVNGYRTARPIGKRGRTLDLSVHFAIMDRSVSERFSAVIARAFPNANTVFLSSTLAIFSSLRDMYPDREDFFIVSAGTELTEIAIVRGGVILESTTFPLGSNFLIRSVMDAQRGADPEAAHSLFRLVRSGSAHPDQERVVMGALALARAEWLRAIGAALELFSEAMPLPADAFLFASGEFADWFAAALADQSLSTLSFAQEPFHVIPVTARETEEFVRFRAAAPYHQPLALSALHVSRLART